MIRIKKGVAPTILSNAKNRGMRETARLNAEHDAGTRTFKFESTIYGAKSVKNALIKAQHGKCAFCESKINHISYGDVEHFRPKGGFRQQAKDSLEQPGYYWLAYAWENLFLSCTLCNQRFKGNLFPLQNPASRIRSHKSAVETERPVFLHPENDNPIEFIAFREEVPYAIDGNERAEKTIEALGLRRPELIEKRRDYFVEIQSLSRVLKELLDMVASGYVLPDKLRLEMIAIQNLLLARQLPQAEYSSMVCCALE